RLVDDIARLARMGKPGQPDLPQNAAAPAAKAELTRRVRAMEDKLSAGEKQVTKEELSEYFLYSVEGRDTIPTGWAKRIGSFRANEVPITSYYKFAKEHWGDQ